MTTHLTTTVTTVARHIATVDADTDYDLTAQFGFDAADALAVQMTVESVKGPVTWSFSRELLIEGQFTPTGEGDVRVWPCLDTSGSAVVIVELDSPNGQTLLQFPGRDVAGFIAGTLATVPLGAEEVDVDSWLAGLLPD